VVEVIVRIVRRSLMYIGGKDDQDLVGYMLMVLLIVEVQIGP
jgi:hypothetical protein